MLVGKSHVMKNLLDMLCKVQSYMKRILGKHAIGIGQGPVGALMC
jgi:hypothetical protein